MLDRTEQAGGVHMAYFTQRWMPHLQHLQQLIEEGYVGKCHDAQFYYWQEKNREARYDWHYDAEQGNGILGNFGSHMIDAILDGKPASPDFGEGLKVQAVVDAALESDGQGCWISLPQGGA